MNNRSPFGEIHNFTVRQRDEQILVKEKNYLKGKFLGSGGQAECFEVESINEQTGKREKYACKVIQKSKLDDQRRKKKCETELKIHKKLKHKHIVEFKHFFED